MKPGLFNFPRLGNLRRCADRRDAAKHGNTRRAIAKAVEAIVGNRTVETLLREAARPPVDLEALTLKVMEADGVFGQAAPGPQDTPLPPIHDISEYGSTWCTLHRLTTVGNFCSACEAEAAGARVPGSKAATPAPVAHDVRSGEPRLFEIGVMVNRAAVIVAVSEKDALEHVSDWEQAWENYSDLIGVSDVQVISIRPLTASPDNWKAEAHDISRDAEKAIAAASIPEKDTSNPGEGVLYCEEHRTVIKDACMQFCPQCELAAMNDTNPDPDPGRLVTDGAEGGAR